MANTEDILCSWFEKKCSKAFYIRLLTLNVLQKWTSFDAEMQQRTLGNCKMLLRIIVKTVSSNDVFIYLVTYFFLVVINLTNGKRWKHHIPYFLIFGEKKTLSWSDFIWTSLFVRRFIFPLSSVARGVKDRMCSKSYEYNIFLLLRLKSLSITINE